MCTQYMYQYTTYVRKPAGLCVLESEEVRAGAGAWSGGCARVIVCRLSAMKFNVMSLLCTLHAYIYDIYLCICMHIYTHKDTQIKSVCIYIHTKTHK